MKTRQLSLFYSDIQGAEVKRIFRTVGIELSTHEAGRMASCLRNVKWINGLPHVPVANTYSFLGKRGRNEATVFIQDTHHDVFEFLEHNDEIYISFPNLALGISKLRYLRNLKKSQISQLHKGALWLVWIQKGSEEYGLTATFDMEKSIAQAMRNVKNSSTYCAITEDTFAPSCRRAVHHVLPESTHGEIADVEGQLLCMFEDIHDAYHDWCTQKSCKVNAKTLLDFCEEIGFSTNWLSCVELTLAQHGFNLEGKRIR